MQLFLTFLSGVLLFYLFRFFPVSSVISFLSAIAVFSVRRRFSLLPVLVIGILYAFFRHGPAGFDPPDIWNREIRMEGSFVPMASSSQVGGAPEVFTVDSAFFADSEDEIEGLEGREVAVFDDRSPHQDGTYEILFRSGSDRTRLNPGGTRGERPYGSIVAIREIDDPPFSFFRVFKGIRNDLNAYLVRSFPGNEGGLIAAVTTGDTGHLDKNVRDAFNVTGMTHILSISGTHFGLFFFMLFGLFNFLLKRLPYPLLLRMTIYLAPSQASALLCLPFMIMYLGISGGSVPAIRSFVMMALFLAGLLLGRRGFWMTSLFFAAAVLVLWDPAVLLSISFQLSFLAVLFIGFAAEKGDDVDADDPSENRYLDFVKNSLILTLAASLGTSLLVAYYFHYISVISPVSNLLVAPIIGFILIPLSLLSSFAFLATGHYVFGPFVELTARIALSLTSLMAKIPHADLKIAAFPPALLLLFYGGCLLYPVFGKKKYLLAPPFVPLIVYGLFTLFDTRDLNITFLDVGQGDSSVIEFADGKTVVVDTGRTGRETADFLSHRGKREIDALVITHSHPDHSGGMLHILDRFRVREIWDNGLTIYPEAIAQGKKRRVLERGDIIGAGQGEIMVLHPYSGFFPSSENEYQEDNDSSLVLKVKGRKSTVLLAGDIEEEAEEDIAMLGQWIRSDVIKVPHHGGRTSANREFLSAVSPKIAVISAGRDNAFGHPSQELLDRLDGIRLLRTDRDGAVKISDTEKGLSVKTYGQYAFEEADSLAKEITNIKRLFSSW